MAAASTTNCVMTQLQYKNARMTLRGKISRLGNRLTGAKTNLEKFKDVSILLHDYGALPVTLETHHDMLQRKVTLCNEKLNKLHSSISDVATQDKGWTMT